MSAGTPRQRAIAVISAGLGQPSSTRMLAERLGVATDEQLGELGYAAKTDLIELREHAHDLTNLLLTGVPTGGLRGVLDTVTTADGVVAVTPIFNASYAGLFKTFFDVIDADALVGTPVLLAATGGTPRHSLALEHALRPMFSYLRAVTVPTTVYAAAEDWGSGSADTDSLTDRLARAAGELAVLVADRTPASNQDPYVEPVPFEQLLREPGQGERMPRSSFQPGASNAFNDPTLEE